MSGIFRVNVDVMSIAAAATVWSAMVGSNNSIALLEVHLAARSFPANQRLQLALRHGHTANGTGGAAFTPINCAIGGAAAAFTARTEDITTAASGGTIVGLQYEEWDPINPLDIIFAESAQIIVPPGFANRLCLDVLGLAVASATVLSGWALFSEPF